MSELYPASACISAPQLDGKLARIDTVGNTTQALAQQVMTFCGGAPSASVQANGEQP
ncbi:hypothetical protein [Paraburkholderia oxyphila]|uniref:hypothetical protein n=1 Tax=Paraburkholderia oxyphila TaxID=614212 RepID=UPI000A4A27B7|nr:hypothetical protein [Paraburkholderia oxyphila]